MEFLALTIDFNITIFYIFNHPEMPGDSPDSRMINQRPADTGDGKMVENI